MLAVLSTLITVLFVPPEPFEPDVSDDRYLPPNITPAEAITLDTIAQARQQAISAGIVTLRFSFFFLGAALYGEYC